MEALFEWKQGRPVPIFDLTGKDISKLLECINLFDKATEDMVSGNEDNYDYFFCFSQLEEFAMAYPNFLCGSLPYKEGKVLQYFFSIEFKDAEKRAKDRFNNRR